MRRIRSLVLAAVALALFAPAPTAAQRGSIILATTTSTYDSGLLDVLVPRFERESGIDVKVIALGTGAALRMAARGDADVVFVHAPEAERRYVDSGDLLGGRSVMHNDYVIVGPPDDPAGVRGATSLRQAMQAIARNGAFISRGDESGTHTRELALWAEAGIEPAQLDRREETGQGMGATLNIADQRRAYTLSDRGTYLSLKRRLELGVLFGGDPALRNPYHVYAVNPGRHPRVRHAEALRFIEFLVAPSVQKAIAEFKRSELGEQLFFPDALPAAGR